MPDVETTVPALMSVSDAMSQTRRRRTSLIGQLAHNQGRATFTGRLTLERLADLTVAHDRRLAEDTGLSLDSVTQRELIDSHANGLARFMLGGLIDATKRRCQDSMQDHAVITAIERFLEAAGRSPHYGLPQVTLVLPSEPEFERVAGPDDSNVVRLYLPAGTLFLVADGQHRREPAVRVRDFLRSVVTSRRVSRACRLLPVQDALLSPAELDALIGVQETFLSWSMASFEAHIGLNVEEARQVFANYNCNVKPVRQELIGKFDNSNPINQYGRESVIPAVSAASNGEEVLDIRQVASINGFLMLGRTSIRVWPGNVRDIIPVAEEFWRTILGTTEWRRSGSLLREVPVLKGLAKAWFYVFLARRNSRRDRHDQLLAYLACCRFDRAWMEAVPGLSAHTVPADTGSDNGVGFRFSPAHNDIMALIVRDALGIA